jgi:predicted nucleic acid-binding protein
VIYLDSNLLIYLREDLRFAGRVQVALSEKEDDEFAISPLVKAECLVGPMMRNDPDLEAEYMQAFEGFRSLPIRDSTFFAAARIRGANRLKFPDALHLACAQENGCSALWTNDDRMAVDAPGYAIKILK